MALTYGQHYYNDIDNETGLQRSHNFIEQDLFGGTNIQSYIQRYGCRQTIFEIIDTFLENLKDETNFCDDKYNDIENDLNEIITNDLNN